ncbi:MAG: response regulator [Candidatus Competibacteraceae bacterium]|nr:response regulator [Candidatus Competibacteraceae bacterium]
MSTMAMTTNILFVDDETFVLRSMKRLFGSMYNVFTAASGQEAIDVVTNNDIQVVVCDQRMPGMIGVEALRQIKEISPNTMRILLTGYSDLDAVIRSVNDGEIFRYVTKPWNNDVLKDTVSSAARIAQETAETIQVIPAEQAATASGTMPLDLLIIDSDTSVVKTIKQLYQANGKVFSASSTEQALSILEKEDNIGVLVSDIKTVDDDVSGLISALKLHYPYIVTIVYSQLSDVEILGRLINQGQIYRFLLKPIRPELFNRTLHGAKERYYELRSKPGMVKRYQVDAKDDNSLIHQRVRGVGQRLAARLKSFFGFR